MDIKQTIISKEDLQAAPVVKRFVDFDADTSYQLVITNPLLDSEGKIYIRLRKVNSLNKINSLRFKKVDNLSS